MSTDPRRPSKSPAFSSFFDQLYAAGRYALAYELDLGVYETGHPAFADFERDLRAMPPMSVPASRMEQVISHYTAHIQRH
jgi:hypothetical protein